MIRKELLAIMLIATISSLSAVYAQQLITIELTADKDTYDTGDPIMLTGKVSKVVEGSQPTIQVFNPKSVAYSFAQVEVKEDGTFTHQFVVGGKLGIPGEYTIKVTYFGATQSITIQLQPGAKASYPVRFAGETLDVMYVIKNGAVSSIDVDTDFLSILLFIKSEEDQPGSIEITLPRALIDAKDGLKDKEFFVFIDGEPSNYKELRATDQFRTLLIEFPEEAEDIEIVGTNIIPEFPLSSLILALAIVPAIAITIASRIRSDANYSRHSNL